MLKTEYRIKHMDCPSEENLIRLKLAKFDSIYELKFDLPNRYLAIVHDGNGREIDDSIASLNLGDQKMGSAEIHFSQGKKQMKQSRALWIVFAINGAFFLIEMMGGVLSRSMGLVADSLDMLADASVYGLSLLVVNRNDSRKKNVASISAIIQFALAFIGLSEILRRTILGGELPDFSTMIIVSSFALIANIFCLYVLTKSQGKEEAHIKASMIFTSNDVIINLGVVLAGVLVLYFNSNIPDLLIGLVVFIIVIIGAKRMWALGRS